MNNLTDIIADPLYQTNLVLLMLQPSRKASVKPLLHEAGFRLRDIEPKLVLPKELRDQLTASGIRVNQSIDADLILINEDHNYVIFECKASMFGSVPQEGKSDGQIKQARAYLLQTPENLATALSLQTKDISSSWLTYLSKHDPSQPQTEGLQEIAEMLKSSGYQTTAFGLLGLSRDGIYIYLNKNYNPSRLPEPINKLFGEDSLVVHELDYPDEDPRIYYPIPWMPHSSHEDDTSHEMAFGKAVLQQVASIIGKQKPPYEVDLPIDLVINLATKGFYDRWRKQTVVNELKTSAKKMIKDALTPFVEESNIRYINGGSAGAAWKILIDDPKTHSRIIENLRRWNKKKWIDTKQPELFPLN